MLKDLGIQVEKYIASEICEDPIAVGTMRHEGNITYVHDVRNITKRNVSWATRHRGCGGSPQHPWDRISPCPVQEEGATSLVSPNGICPL